MNELGFCEDEICGRNGCKGTIIKDTDSECCSCHISAPCSYCHCEVVCDECGYSSRVEEELRQEVAKPAPTPNWYEEFNKRREEFLLKLNDPSVEFETVEFRTESHTHFSMKKIGAYPRGMSRDDLLKQINGTFGGRFERLTENRFSFIAYTD